jgi:hypothetical protein
MDFGVGFFATHDAVSPGPLARLVDAVADLHGE